jgi:hypothetical protein
MSDAQTLSYESPPTTLSGVGIGTIALQLVGVYCIAYSLPVLSLMLTLFGASGGGAGGGMRTGMWSQMLISLAMPGLYAVVGVLLIRFAPRLSGWLFRHDVGGLMIGPVTSQAGRYLQAVAFSVAGVLTMVNAAPRLVSMIGLSLMNRGGRLSGYPQMVEPIAQLVLGLVLFLQSKGLSRLWHKIRAGGAGAVIGPHAPAPAHEPQPGHTDSERA